jgi:hypothetical protein
MSTLANKNINQQEEHKGVKKSYVSQPNKKETLSKIMPSHESELKSAWQDEHVLDDFRW